MIDVELKARIQESNITPEAKHEADLPSWLEKWLAFCHKALIDGLLKDYFRRLLDQKIEQKNPNIPVYLSTYLSVFFTDLLFQCCEELNWFPGKKLSKKYMEGYFANLLELDRRYEKEEAIMKAYFESYCQEWLQKKIDAVSHLDAKALSKKVFAFFLEAYGLGFIDIECQSQIKFMLKEQSLANPNKIEILQDNFQILYSCFIDFMEKNASHSEKFHQEIRGETMTEIKNAMALSDIKTNLLFKKVLWPFLLYQTFEQDEVNLQLAPDNHLVEDDKEQLTTILETGKFKIFEIRKNQEFFIFNEKSGVIENENVFSKKQVNALHYIIDLLREERRVSRDKRKNFHIQCGSNNLESRLRLLAKQAIASISGDEFSLDDTFKFSKLGEKGIKIYLALLNDRFLNQIGKDEIKKGYSLFLPKKNKKKHLDLDIIKGLNEFLKQQLKGDSQYLFFCQKMAIYINPKKKKWEYYKQLGKLIKLLDKAGLAKLTIHLKTLEEENQQQLLEQLYVVKNLIVRFDGLIKKKRALFLEATNDANLQSRVPYSPCLKRVKNAPKEDLSKQPSPITASKIKLLLNQKIELHPVEGKIGCQNQHHVQLKAQDKTETKILKSWQIKQNTQTRYESNCGYDMLSGDEKNSLISWQHIKAAFDPHHPNHESSRLKLGEEILQYHYKGRNLTDLWQRITGNVSLTKQDRIVGDEHTFRLVQHYSPLIPKQISYQALLTIVRHPHLFQDGLHLENLPPQFGFNSMDGALFIDHSKDHAYFNQFTLVFNALPEGSLPSASYFSLLVKSGLPSVRFFYQLERSMSAYHAWQYWRQGFSALNALNERGIDALNIVYEQCRKKVKEHQPILLHYVIQALNDYFYWKKSRQNSQLTSNMAAFEHRQGQEYEEGGLDCLSTAAMDELPEEVRRYIHKELVVITNTPSFLALNQHQQSYQKLLSDLLSYYEKDKSEIDNGKIWKNEKSFMALQKALGTNNVIKLIELIVSQHVSVVYNIFSMLEAIRHRWGKIGLADFKQAFLDPVINLAPLALPEYQQALFQLLEFSVPQYHWWQQLVRQHVEQSGHADFVVLMDAFQYFLDELEMFNLAGELAIPCPLQGIKNLQVGLNRVISLLKKSKKPAEQWRQLQGLDWSACGVLYATQSLDYQFVNADMKLTFEHELAFSEFSKTQEGIPHYQAFDHYNAQPFSSYSLKKWQDKNAMQDLFKFTLSFFFRYIASRKFAPPMTVYYQWLDALALPENYSLIEEIQGIVYIDGQLRTDIRYVGDVKALLLTMFLPIIAYASTGRHALDNLSFNQEERIQKLKQFILAVYECACERSIDKAMDQLLLEKKAVAYEKLILILSACAEFYPQRDIFRSKQEVDNQIQPDFEALSFILQSIKKSRDNWYSLGENQHKFFSRLRTNLENPSFWCWDQMLGRLDNQLIYTQEFLKKYPSYFLEAIHRLHDNHFQSDYACFLMICLGIDAQSFSFENKCFLIKIASLLTFKLSHFAKDAAAFLQWMQVLAHEEKNRKTASLEQRLRALSCLGYPLTIEQLREATEQDQILGLQDIDAEQDGDFYADPLSLDKAFPGLGSFYDLIKKLLLQGYPVALGDNKRQAWQAFLTFIHQIGTREKQHLLLQSLSQDARQKVDLITLNSWLEVFADDEGNRVAFHPDYFKAMTDALLHHPEKHDFIQLLNDWMAYHYPWRTVATNTGFINLLSHLAFIENVNVCLDNFYNAARAMSWISYASAYPWYDTFITLMHRSPDANTLNTLFFALSKLAEQALEGHFDAILLQWLSNLNQHFELTLMLAVDWDARFQDQSYYILHILAQVRDAPLLSLYKKLKTLSETDLKKLALCYQCQPVPTYSALNALFLDEMTLNEFILNHRIDPHQERDESCLKRQFDNEMLWPYIEKANYLDIEYKLPLPFASLMHAQLTFINQLGYGEMRYLSLEEIGSKLQACRRSFSKSDEHEERLVFALTAISLMREAIYKSSQAPAILWPSAVQMLALLSTLNHPIEKEKHEAPPTFLQLATGEGKSLLALFLAVLTWLEGKPVVLITNRASLALRDANAYAPLFKCLGIPCAYLSAEGYQRQINFNLWLEKTAGKPEFDGVYFSEFNDFALIRQQHLLNKGKDLPAMSFILDEADAHLLHNQTDNNLTQTGGFNDAHPQAWVFEALTAFVNSHASKEGSWHLKLNELVDYLSDFYPMAARDCEQVAFLKKLPTYLQAVWQAQTLVEGVDFIPKPQKQGRDTYYAAVLLQDKPMPPHVTFNGLIQQALHGRLNYEAKKQQSQRYFPIAPETTLFSSMSPEALLDWMHQKGRVLALSATIGSNAERLEIQKKCGFEFIKFPKMQNSLRMDYPMQFCKNQQDQLRAIAEICTHYGEERTQAKSYAMLIIVDNIPFAKRLSQYLSRHTKVSNPCLLHAGIDDLCDQTLSELETLSGRPGHILIAMSGLINRGFDAKLRSTHQLVVIDTCLKNKVEETQAKGRCSRMNPLTGFRDRGKFYAIYDLEREIQRYPHLAVKAQDILSYPEAFRQKQYFARYQQDSALRLHRQLASQGRNVIQAHFFELWQKLFNQETILKKDRDNIMSLYANALEKIMSVSPSEEFALMTEKGELARENYNQRLLAIYKEALEAMPLPFNIEKTLTYLFDAMDVQQQQYLLNHKKALAMGPNQPKVKIYKQWKQGVKFNAYLDAGKQGMGNYLFEWYKAWRLPPEEQRQIQFEKNELEKKLAHKNQTRADFLTPLMAIMRHGNLSDDPVEQWLRLYYRHDDVCEKGQESSAIEEQGVGCLIKRFHQQERVMFIHDPLMGKIASLQLISHRLESFQALQKNVDAIFAAYPNMPPLMFQITRLHQQYKLTIDFSTHAFDVIDRPACLDLLAEPFGINIQPLFDNIPPPSLKLMQQIVQSLEYDCPSRSDDLQTIFQNASLSLNRKNYYKILFIPVVNWLKKQEHHLDEKWQRLLKAILNMNKPLCYEQHSGLPCQAYAAGLDTLPAILAYEKKREILDFIYQQLAILKKAPLSDSLLFRQQVECLRMLSLDLIKAPASQSLSFIYEHWQNTTISYQKQNLTTHNLMQLRTQQVGFLGKTLSPDVRYICQEIEHMMSQHQDKVHSVSVMEKDF